MFLYRIGGGGFETRLRWRTHRRTKLGLHRARSGQSSQWAWWRPRVLLRDCWAVRRERVCIHSFIKTRLADGLDRCSKSKEREKKERVLPKNENGSRISRETVRSSQIRFGVNATGRKFPGSPSGHHRQTRGFFLPLFYIFVFARYRVRESRAATPDLDLLCFLVCDTLRPVTAITL